MLQVSGLTWFQVLSLPIIFTWPVSQVVDIISTWKSLGPELSCDSRPLMVKAVAELLSLVPQLSVKSEEYEVPNVTCCLFN